MSRLLKVLADGKGVRGTERLKEAAAPAHAPYLRPVGKVGKV